jgi:hypothetical protein
MRRPPNSRTISFRLGGKLLTELDRQAEALGVSAGDLSRAIVERHLSRDDSRATLEAIEALGRRHEVLARDLDKVLSGIEDGLTSLRQDFHRALREVP